MIDMKLSKKYKCIVIDPPWNQGKTGLRKSRPNQTKFLEYQTMSKNEIMELPISNISEDQSYLWLWATNSKDKKTKEPILKMAFDLMEHWGFTFYTMITWDKKTGPCPFGPYQITTEYILFGYKGKANFPKNSLGKMRTCFTEPSTAHSVKPNSFYKKISELFDGEKVDIFARQARYGFDGWGNEYNSLPIDVKKPKSLVA